MADRNSVTEAPPVPKAPKADARHGQTGRIPDLDGLRGIAILLVCLFHFNSVATTPGLFGRLVDTLFLHLWFGVDLFFVLSGFLITKILLEAKGSASYFSAFYMRRVLRIFPLYYLTLLVYLFVSIVRQLHTGQPQDYTTQLAFWFYLQNWAILWHRAIGVIGHFWSLAVEEQFYLGWPLLIYWLSRRGLKRLCLALIAVAFFVKLAILFFQLPSPDLSVYASYTLTPARLDTLAIGGLAALLVTSGREGFRSGFLLGLCLVPAAILLFVESVGGQTKFWFKAVEYSMLAPLFGVFVARSAFRSSKRGLAEMFLRSRPLQAAGKFSYAMYVVHWPLHIFMSAWAAEIIVRQPPGLQTPAKIAYILLAILVTYALGWISWHLIEKRVLSLKRLFPMKTIAVQR